MSNPEMMRAFLEASGEKPHKPKSERRGIRQKTKKQELLDARWAGIKDTMLFLGYGCAQANESCFGPLDLDHKQSRAQGGSYDAANGEILCRFHHQERHGTLQFGRTDPSQGDAS